MTTNYKIGLSRCRLFDFQNVVTFVGEYKEEFNEKELQKALKMLSVKQPLITSQIELSENSEAILHPERVEPEFIFAEADVDELVDDKKTQGLNFWEKLFEFYVLNKNTLVVFSHTVVSDAKSLLVLVKQLLAYYNKETVSVEPEKIKLFKTEAEIPLEAESFVADKVTEVLNNDWLIKSNRFTVEDYKKAKEKFWQNYTGFKNTDFVFSDELTALLTEKSKELKVDASSLVAFALFKAFSNENKPKDKSIKMNMTLDRRPYFVDRASYSVGAFNGTTALELSGKQGNLTEQAKEFHKTYYKKFSECFSAFYNEMFLGKLEPAFLDSMFMYKAGLFKGKPTKKLATLYGCEQKFLLGFSSYNLNQKTWEKLSTFTHILVNEPHKSNQCVTFSLVMGEKNTLYIEWEKSVFSDEKIKNLLNCFVSLLKQI
ncbi:MAG: hypothetical protein IKJ86_05370 [Clostridia bacterium]|nr:hypothetical protein [Clostridia bacterium]